MPPIYEKNLQDVIFGTTSFLLNFNELKPPICRFFDWTLLEFLGKLSLLANEVLKCAMNTGREVLVKLLILWTRHSQRGRPALQRQQKKPVKYT